MATEAGRPAFYALAPGGWRDYVTLLHPPYTAWHLSYVAIGAALTPAFAWDRFALTLAAFFLAGLYHGLWRYASTVTLFQVAKGVTLSALGLAILSTFSVSKTEDSLSGLGREPGPADQAQALVDGFHVAYVGSAALVAAAAVLLAVLLRREDVIAVGEGVAEPVAA